MKYKDIITERAQAQYYIHVTDKANIKSILKKGLIPNHANDGQGRYDDTRWISLNGIYATNSPSKIINIINSFSFSTSLAFVVLSVIPQSTLPDEDAIELLMSRCYKKVMGDYGIDSHFANMPSEYFEHRENDPDFELHPEDLQDEDDLWRKVTEYFHIAAANGNNSITRDDNILNELLWYWRAYHVEEYEGSETDPSEWMDVKDAIVRKYRGIEAGDFKKYTSVRITHPVTFGGRNRIVAIVDDQGKPLYGQVPPEAAALLNQVL